MAYIRGENKPEGSDEDGCPFCRLIGMDDEDTLVVARGELVFWSTIAHMFVVFPSNAALGQLPVAGFCCCRTEFAFVHRSRCRSDLTTRILR